MSQSAMAPDNTRIDVKVAGSIAVYFNAIRHRRELPAKAIIASDVRIKTRVREFILNHSITLSARTSNDCGNVRPRPLAVLLLMTSSNVVGRSTGRVAGVGPGRSLD